MADLIQSLYLGLAVSDSLGNPIRNGL